MDWNLKNPLQWDWENLALFCEKESEMSKNAKQAEWIPDGGVISNGSMYSSGSGTCSGSELGNGSSKNSVTVSVGSSSKAGNKISVVNFEPNGGFLDDQNNACEIDLGDDTRTGHVTGSGEPLIGLKLGKRTYFENLASADIKTPSAVSLVPPAASLKRSKACHQAVQAFYCQVEGCNIDLTTAKDYHRKHRVCECHSKSPKVIVAGHDRRFCQQCSRFHDLSEFDQKKRSCRRRLSEHNARRRKPQAETLSFNPTMLPSAFYEERQQMDFFLNLAPLSHLRLSTSSLRDDSRGFSISMTKGTWNRTTKAVADAQPLSPRMNFTNAATSSGDGINRLMPAKCVFNEVLNQGLEASASASNMNGAPDLRRALSLLSNDAWVPSSTAQSNAVHLGSSSTIAASPPFQVVPSAPESWQDDHTLTFNFHGSGSQAQELHFSKVPYDSSIFEANEVL